MKAVVALGANIGNPEEQLNLAVAMLRESTDLLSVSSFYLTKAVGGPDQPDYLNAVCILESELPAMELLSLLQILCDLWKLNAPRNGCGVAVCL